MSKLKIEAEVPLTPLSTFKIGGKAKYFVEVATPEALIEAAGWAEKRGVGWVVFSGGSNVLFPDEGLDCLAIKFLGMGVKFEEGRVEVDAGYPLAALIKKTIDKGWGGLEKLAGIPGSVGGAVVGNTGAYGGSIAEIVEKVEIWDGKKRRWLNKKECGFEYRHSVFKEKPWLVLRVVLKFKKSESGVLEKTYLEIIKDRTGKFSTGVACPGCFFKNILVKDLPKETLALMDKSKIKGGKMPTGWLLDQVGAKGMRVGKIKVADFHANWLINEGGGTAKEVKELAAILKKKVKEKFGIELEEEVRIF